MARSALDAGVLLCVLLPSLASSRVVQEHAVQAQATDTWALRQLPRWQSLTSTAEPQPAGMAALRLTRTRHDAGLVRMASSARRNASAHRQLWTPPTSKLREVFASVGLAASLLLSNLPAHAENELAVLAAQKSSSELVDPTCFAKKCSVPMTKCIGDFDCIKGLACSAKCSGDSQCTVGCFARYNSPILEDVLHCTVEEAGCIDIATQVRAPDALQDAPRPPKRLVPATPATMEGRWYKVMGFNKKYDCFDCQTNTFSAVDFTEAQDTSTEEATSRVSVEYSMPRQRIFNRRVGSPATPIKSTVQEELVFDAPNSRRTARTQGRMFGLTFWENWYVIGANTPEQPEFRFIYYTGKTLESRYQGAFVYTRTPELPTDLLPTVDKIARQAGLNPAKGCFIDNKCYIAPSEPEEQQGPLGQFTSWLDDARHTLQRYDLPELVEEVLRSPQPYQLYSDQGVGDGRDAGQTASLGPAPDDDLPGKRVLSQLGGGIAGGMTGAVAGALDGGEAGAKAGGMTGRLIGGGVGSTVGGLVGGTVGTIIGGVVKAGLDGSVEWGGEEAKTYDVATAGTILAGVDGATAGGIAGGTFGSILGRLLGGKRFVRSASDALDVEELPNPAEYAHEFRVDAVPRKRKDLLAREEK